MQVDIIRTNSNINFKANFFKVKKYGQKSGIYIITDNSENLGSRPVLETQTSQIPMVYDGKYYTTEYTIHDNKYKIKYEDTGKYENNGKEKCFIPEKLQEQTNHLNRTPDLILSEGSAQGKLVKAKNINETVLNSNEPLIIICENDKECYKYFNRASGMILKSAPAELLSHFAALCRDYFSFGMLITDKKILNDLHNLEGKFISISNENKNIEFKTIEEIGNTIQYNTIQYNTIEIPKMKKVDRILSLDECEKDTVGNKAYNLKRMKNLVKEGKLQDVIIPNAFVLPYGYLEKIEKLIEKNPQNRWQDNEILEEIKNYAEKVITRRDVMVRSAFNGEDLEGYSAAGLYDSFSQNRKNLDLGIIYDVMNSKNKPIAVKSREKHNIPADLIKPCVIIQDQISSDYSFTTYTESPFDKNKMLIELFINKDRYCKPEPYQITYNKQTKELLIEKEHSKYEEYIFDENYKLIHKGSTSPKNINKIWAVIEKLVKNALVLEQEFGKPQDIEGGIKNAQLYFWQARNIVKKFH